VSNCYNGTFADNFSRSCLSVCPRNPPLYSNNLTMTCVAVCPPGMFSFDNTRECFYYCPVSDGFYR
jgi:hypothetical protein